MKDTCSSFRILTCYYLTKPGGFCKRLFRAINALLDRGHVVHYLAVAKFPIDHPNCHFHRFPWPKKYASGAVFWLFFHLLAPFHLLFLSFKYNIDRSFVFGYNYSLFLQPVRIIKKIPLTLFLRADSIENHIIKGRSSLLIRLEHIIEGFGIQGTRLYGVSETLTTKTVSRHAYLKPAKIGVLRNDIPPSPKINNKRRSPKFPLRIACVGIFEPRKNQLLLIRMMERMDPDLVQLYLYGVGPDEQLLQQIVIENNLSNRVHFMGWVESTNIWPQIDLLFIPSLHEGAPNALLEAIGNNVPVFASDIPEHREILPKSYLMDIRSVETVVQLVNKIINNKKILKKESFAESIIIKQLFFNWDTSSVNLIVAP